ncbi:MAG TPA: hypothetical protein VGE63_02705 [Candidatus Paceibacterota bacterium]
MKKKPAPQPQQHLYTPLAVGVLIVGGLIVSVYSNMGKVVYDQPRMGGEVASADNNTEPLPIQKELLSAYSTDNRVYIVFPDTIINTVQPKPTQFSVIDDGSLNPVMYVAAQGNSLILELQNQPTGKGMTVSYRDVVQGRLYTQQSGFIQSFREKVVVPTENIDADIARACADRIPLTITKDSSREDIIRVQWFLNKEGYYFGKATGVMNQDLVNAIGKFQVVNAEKLVDTGFDIDVYSTWEQHTAKMAQTMACLDTQ